VGDRSARGTGRALRDFIALRRPARARPLHLFQLGGDQQVFDQTAEVGLHRRVRIADAQTFDNCLVSIVQGCVADFPRSLWIFNFIEIAPKARRLA